MKEVWKGIWENRGSDVQDYSYESLLKINGYDGAQSIITPDTLYPAINRYEREMRIERGDSIYEVGCGAGAALYHWERMGYEVGGCDLSGNLINVAKTAIPKGSWDVCEAVKIPVKPSYDHVIAFGVFFYFANYEYAKDVLYRMIMKAKRSVSIFDIPDLSKMQACENFRRSLIPDYDEKYKGMTHLYYAKSWWIGTLNDLGLSFNIYDQAIEGYENGNYRYNVTIRL